MEGRRDNAIFVGDSPIQLVFSVVGNNMQTAIDVQNAMKY